jgi:transposase InsO family protein
VLHIDNRGKFTIVEFTAYCAYDGIQRHYSTSYSPQQNGVIKHQNQTVVTTACGLGRVCAAFRVLRSLIMFALIGCSRPIIFLVYHIETSMGEKASEIRSPSSRTRDKLECLRVGY